MRSAPRNTFLRRLTVALSATVVMAALALTAAVQLPACSNGSGPDDARSGLDLNRLEAGGGDDQVVTPPDGSTPPPDVTATPDAVAVNDAGPDGITTPPDGGTPQPDLVTPPPDQPACDNGNVDTMDLTQEGLTAFVKSGAYTCWLAEPAIHPSAGPHAQTGVRIFFNDKVAASLAAGNATHPRGSILVKELYNGSAISGHAIDLKIEDGTGASTWLFFEGFAPTYNGYYGVANSTCTGCHSQGVDYVRTGLPR